MLEQFLCPVMLVLPYIAVCCGQDPVFVNQGPSTEVLARSALNGHNVLDGVRRRDVSTYDTGLYHILTCVTNQHTSEFTDSIFNLSEICLDFPFTCAL